MRSTERRILFYFILTWIHVSIFFPCCYDMNRFLTKCLFRESPINIVFDHEIVFDREYKGVVTHQSTGRADVRESERKIELSRVRRYRVSASRNMSASSVWPQTASGGHNLIRKPFVAIAPRSTRIRSRNIIQSPISASKRTAWDAL